jgi:hypothetical protein
MIGSITKPMTTMLAAALVVASHVDPAAVVLYLGRYSPFNVGRGEDYAAARSDCSGRWGAGQ